MVFSEIGPAWYQVHPDWSSDGIGFGQGSANLTVTFAGLDDAPVRTVNLAKPARNELIGYGRFEGMRETYRRAVSVDSKGIHGVRTAVYRRDTQRQHTNVWFHYQAKDLDGRIYVTEAGQWNWQGGKRDLEQYGDFVWPTLPENHAAFRSFDTFFSVTPVGGAFTSILTAYVFDTNATSPTSGISGCVQLRYYSADPSAEHIVYWHPEYGLTEVVYAWQEGGRPDQHHIIPGWLIPIDGFALDVEASEPEALTLFHARNALSGAWSGVAFPDASNSDLNFRIELSRYGTRSAPNSARYSVDGTYTDDRVYQIPVFGHVDERTGELRLISRSKRILLELRGVIGDEAGTTSIALDWLVRLDFSDGASQRYSQGGLTRPE